MSAITIINISNYYYLLSIGLWFIMSAFVWGLLLLFLLFASRRNPGTAASPEIGAQILRGKKT